MATTEADYVADLACQNTGGVHVGFDRPWRGDKHAEAKERFFRFVRQNRYNGNPTRIVEAVKAIYGSDYSNAEYKRLSRLAKGSDWFVTGPNGTVEPTAECFNAAGLESAVSESAKSVPSCDSDCQKKTESETEAEATESYPKDRVKSILEKRIRLDDGKFRDKHDYRAELLRELATYKTQISDKYVYFQRKHDLVGLPNYLIKKYSTRFNDEGTATDKQIGFRQALMRAANRFKHGAMVSLTVDGKRFESHAEATEAASKAVSDWLNREGYQLGKSVDYVKVHDFQDNGLIHFHVCLFGVHVVSGETEAGRPTISKSHVQGYWDGQKGIGKQVKVQPIHERNGDWILHTDEDGGRQTVRLYLGKRIRELVEISSMSGKELKQEAEAGNTRLWPHALFWATQKQYYTTSQSLKDEPEGDTESSKYSWVYVGTCTFEQIPQYVIDDSVNYGRPPPGSTESASSGTAT